MSEQQQLEQCIWILEELKSEPRPLNSWDWESVDKVIGLIEDKIEYLRNIEN